MDALPATSTDPTDALSSVPAAGARRGLGVPGRLRFFYGPKDHMDTHHGDLARLTSAFVR